MSLKVAHKVILGFAIILLLLLFASISSFRILMDIKQSTAQVDELAIPVQDYSNNIQIQLLKQAKLSALISSSQNLDELAALQAQFNNEGEKLAKQVNGLSKMLAGQSTERFLKDFNGFYTNYSQSVATMFGHKEAVLAKTAQLGSQQNELDRYLDEAGALLVDLSYLEDADKQTLIDRIAGSAGQIEGYIINLTNSAKEIVSLEQMDEVVGSKDTIELAISNIDQLLVFLKRLGEEYDTDGLIEQFVEEFEKSKNTLVGENSLFDLKIAQLEHVKSLNESFGQSEGFANQSITTIDELLTVVAKNLRELQLAVFDNVDRGQTSTIVILLVLFVTGSGIAFATVRAMIIPLRRINNVLSYMAKGDLSRQLTVKSEDEYGELSKNVNLVVEDLRRLIAEISSNAHLLNNAAEQSSEEIEHVSQSLQQQKVTVEKVTQITDELNLNADHVLEKATDAEQKMIQAIGQSDELKTIANATNDRIHTLVNMLSSTATLMAVLQRESNNIGGILETIQSIADQTNLLALNAAIEAARAGEAGRGFAVVADEVRLLASRTQESTAEINAMIESLQSQTAKAVSDIDNGKEEANNCQQHTNELLETLLLINAAIAHMHEMSADIAHSATQQNSLSNDINLSIADIVHMSQQSSDKSLSTLSYSKQVASLAKKLDKSVDQFTV
ncbi:methyl-accepting chemotaxis protein [Colwelliaceae bacterium 6471]